MEPVNLNILTVTNQEIDQNVESKINSKDWSRAWMVMIEDISLMIKGIDLNENIDLLLNLEIERKQQHENLKRNKRRM